ncbi:2665_t:CDS:1, partial [Paraglomus occultum]
NAWVDEDIMAYWVHHMWRPWMRNTTPNLLVADVHRAQKTNKILNMLRECNTTVALVPPGCTSLVQPLDVSFNAQFKQ